MKVNNKIEIALDSNAQFFIFEGNKELTLSSVEMFYDKKNAEITYIEASELKADATRELVSVLNTKAIHLDVTIVLDMNKLHVTSQNILLKSLENLGNSRIIVGICETQEGLLDTIRSRGYYQYISNQEQALPERAELLDNHINKLEKLMLFSRDFDENNIFVYNFKVGDIQSKENLSKKIRLNNLVLEYNNRIDANVNKDLCKDLLAYKILEDK